MEQFEEFGRRLTPPKAAKILGMSAQKLRRLYREYGGFKDGSRVYFYEGGLRRALQGKIQGSLDGQVDRTGEDRRESLHPPVQDTQRSVGVGRATKKPRTSGGVGADPHGIVA